MATRVSWAPEEMIISLFIATAPATDPGHQNTPENLPQTNTEQHRSDPCLSVFVRGRYQPCSSVAHRSAALIGKPSHPHVEDEAKTREGRDEGRTAVTHERQRDPLDQRQACRHHHVVNHPERKPGNDPSHQKRAE